MKKNLIKRLALSLTVAAVLLPSTYTFAAEETSTLPAEARQEGKDPFETFLSDGIINQSTYDAITAYREEKRAEMPEMTQGERPEGLATGEAPVKPEGGTPPVKPEREASADRPEPPEDAESTGQGGGPGGGRMKQNIQGTLDELLSDAIITQAQYDAMLEAMQKAMQEMPEASKTA